MKMRIAVAAFLFVVCVGCRADVSAGSMEDMPTGSTVDTLADAAESAWKASAEEPDDYLDAILKELDFGKLDEFVETQLPDKTTFTDVVVLLLREGFSEEELAVLGRWALDQLFYEIANAKPFFVQILVLAILFSFFSQLGSSMGKQVTDMGFLVIYGAMMILLMQSFTLISGVVTEGMEQVFSFLSVLIPVYSTTLFLSGNAMSASFFYELAFSVVWLAEWVMIHILVPAIHIFLLLEFLDHLFEEEKLSKLTDLIEGTVRRFLKTAMGIIIGLSAVQSLILPAKDRIAGSTVIKSFSMLPGVGNAFGSVGEILIGCGMLIKNTVGIAAVVILLFISMGPVIKVACFSFMYRMLAAMIQPIAKRRLTGCVQGVARGCQLYESVFLHTMLLFLIVISMVAAATSFVF